MKITLRSNRAMLAESLFVELARQRIEQSVLQHHVVVPDSFMASWLLQQAARAHVCLLDVKLYVEVPAFPSHCFHFFGFRELTSPHLALFFSQEIPSFWYVFSPCAHFWSDLLSEKEMSKRIARVDGKGKNGVEQTLDHFYSEANALLANTALLGRASAKLLDHVPCDIDALYPIADQLIHCSPYQERIFGEHFYAQDVKVTLLERIKADLICLVGARKEKESFVADGSIVMSNAPTMRSEICAIKDALVELSQQAPLKVGDVLILTPHPSQYEAAIRHVLQDHTSLKLQVVYEEIPEFVGYVQKWLELLISRFDKDKVIAFASMPQMASLLECSIEELQDLVNWISSSDFSWGLCSEFCKSQLEAFCISPAQEELESGTIEKEVRTIVESHFEKQLLKTYAQSLNDITLRFFSLLEAVGTAWELPLFLKERTLEYWLQKMQDLGDLLAPSFSSEERMCFARAISDIYPNKMKNCSCASSAACEIYSASCSDDNMSDVTKFKLQALASSADNASSCFGKTSECRDTSEMLVSSSAFFSLFLEKLGAVCRMKKAPLVGHVLLGSLSCTYPCPARLIAIVGMGDEQMRTFYSSMPQVLSKERGLVRDRLSYACIDALMHAKEKFLLSYIGWDFVIKQSSEPSLFLEHLSQYIESQFGLSVYEKRNCLEWVRLRTCFKPFIPKTTVSPLFEPPAEMDVADFCYAISDPLLYFMREKVGYRYESRSRQRPSLFASTSELEKTFSRELLAIPSKKKQQKKGIACSLVQYELSELRKGVASFIEPYVKQGAFQSCPLRYVGDLQATKVHGTICIYPPFASVVVAENLEKTMLDGLWTKLTLLSSMESKETSDVLFALQGKVKKMDSLVNKTMLESFWVKMHEMPFPFHSTLLSVLLSKNVSFASFESKLYEKEGDGNRLISAFLLYTSPHDREEWFPLWKEYAQQLVAPWVAWVKESSEDAV